MDEIFIDSCGKKRVGIRKLCKQCNKEFITRKDFNNDCCSIVCRGLTKRKGIIINCAWCKKEFYRSYFRQSKSKSGVQLCSRKCKDEAQKLGGIEEIMPLHFGTLDPKKRYREKFTIEELVCNRCGYKEFTCSVQIHHIDKNHDNYNDDNLITLCGNCHTGLHNNKWKLEDIEGPIA